MGSGQIWWHAGGVLTCGVTGISAGLSHAPVDSHGKERYVFFAFPHIAVDETGEPAAIFRPGREGKSSACGALMYATSAVQVCPQCRQTLSCCMCSC